MAGDVKRNRRRVGGWLGVYSKFSSGIGHEALWAESGGPQEDTEVPAGTQFLQVAQAWRWGWRCSRS